jgi:hypothetical protein
MCRNYPPRVEGGEMNASDIIQRMRQVYAAKSDSALAAALNLAPSAPSNWRQRNRPPFGICVAVARARGISLDWLILGAGNMRQDGGTQVRDTSDVAYRVRSDAARRITHFVAVWDATRSAEEMIWLEQHLRRTVAEYRDWLGENAVDEPRAPP